MQETHSTKNTEKQWQKEWDRMSFWNSGPPHQTAGIASLFSKNFQGKIHNIKNDNTERIQEQPNKFFFDQEKQKQKKNKTTIVNTKQ